MICIESPASPPHADHGAPCRVVSWALGKTLSPLLPFPYGATDTDHESQQSAIKKTVQCYKSEGPGVWGCPRRRSVSWDLKGQRFCWWGRAWHRLKDLTAFSPSREVSRVDWNARHKTGLQDTRQGCGALQRAAAWPLPSVGAESGFANASSRHPQSTGGPRRQDPARGAACRAWEAGCFVIDPGVTLGREPLLLVALALSACWKRTVLG